MKTPTALVMLCVLTGAALAQSPQEIAGTLKDACQNELATYCKAVTPGEGRAFACLYAYTDKLSAPCERMLYNAATELEYAITKLNYVANACAADLTNYCSGTEAGQGRIAECLKTNQNRVTPACQNAIQETGLMSK
jgi:hypothetical protein